MQENDCKTWWVFVTDIPVYWKLSQFMNLDIVYSFYIIVCTSSWNVIVRTDIILEVFFIVEEFSSGTINRGMFVTLSVKRVRQSTRTTEKHTNTYPEITNKNKNYNICFIIFINKTVLLKKISFFRFI
jgi:hypothetical protein